MRALASWALLSLVFVACAASNDKIERQDPGSGSGGSGGGLVIGGGMGSLCDPTAPDSPCSPTAPAPPGCGDGVLTADEACDDGNLEDADGCWANCLGVEPGYSCQPPGQLCHEIARCGDGVVSLSEPCDDANVDDGDGCSSRCKLEIGYKCEGSPSTCSATTCGDGVQEGAESCEDGNTLPFDGCSAICQAEPDCAGGPCTSECGDGLIINEDCDDGNTAAGDGCAPDCTVEEGFTCEPQATACEMINGACVLRVAAIFRDFNADHSDFQESCTMGVQGIVAADLGSDGKPVLALANTSSACISSADSFGEWYTDNESNATIGGSIVLFDNGDGGFVNRWGANGEQWGGEASYADLRWCGNGGTNCAMCTLAPGEECWDPCTPWNSSNGSECAGSVAGALFDGNPVFFPIDDHPDALTDTRYPAKIADVYGWPSWPWEADVVPDAPDHNFHFTTEVVYWFQYDAANAATLEFTGDDDVWVFVNGKLAVDLGGFHPPETDSVTIDSTTAADFGLEDGQVYKISVFHAERKTEGSSFKLTLEGFNSARSDCLAVCGDAIVALGEECDDGVNDGGYGECFEGCVLGAYCGDGIVQEGEDCDDGNRVDGDLCGSACRMLVVK
jgi:fibro-slime domain-containing protein